MEIPVVDKPEARFVWIYETPHGLVPRRVARAILAEAQNHRCCYCGVQMIDHDLDSSSPRRCTIEHIVPVSRGGDNRWENLAAACAGCNATRPSSMLAIAYFYARNTLHEPNDMARKPERPMRPPLVAKAANGQVVAVFMPKLRKTAEAQERERAHTEAVRKWKEAIRGVEIAAVERYENKPLKKAKQRRKAMIAMVGHDVSFGSNRLPSA